MRRSTAREYSVARLQGPWSAEAPRFAAARSLLARLSLRPEEEAEAILRRGDSLWVLQRERGEVLGLLSFSWSEQFVFELGEISFLRLGGFGVEPAHAEVGPLLGEELRAELRQRDRSRSRAVVAWCESDAWGAARALAEVPGAQEPHETTGYSPYASLLVEQIQTLLLPPHPPAPRVLLRVLERPWLTR